MSSLSRIAVLTSGGDSPGMNAAVRAVVRAADAAGVPCMAITDGYRGMIQNWIAPIDARDVSGIVQLGGTKLGTARSKKFRTEEGRAIAAANLKEAGIEGLVVIGGDGSMEGAKKLSDEHGVRVIGVPGTIDNDLSGTDFTLGFDTAVNTIVTAIDKVRDTASSHHRLFFIEVMGRHSGWLALYSGIACGATAVLVPETKTDCDDVRKRVIESFDMGKRFCIVVVAEGDEAGGAFETANKVCVGIDVDYRVSVLGHMQRGGAPSMRDRVLGARLGDEAVKALLEGDDQKMIGEQKLQLIRTPIDQTYSEDDRDFHSLLELMDRLAR